jgi:hypothetical protein
MGDVVNRFTGLPDALGDRMESFGNLLAAAARG